MVEKLLDAFAGIPEEYVEKTARTMGYLPEKRRRPVLRNLLIAAALTALLAATAVASGLYSRGQRLAEMPASPAGEQRTALIPNGFQGTPTYLGSAEWWAFMARWEDTHDVQNQNYDLEFTKGDLDKYQICSLYNAYDEQQADKLYEIAEKYDLKLYKESLYFDEYGGREFFALTGAEPFADISEENRFCGYVFDDGSFKLECDLDVGGETVFCTIRRIRTGSIYPYGGAGTDPFEHREEEYMTKNQEQVLIDIPVDTTYPYKADVTYVSPDGKTWIDVSISAMDGKDRDYLQQAKELSDALSFKALSVRNKTAEKILNRSTGAEDNRSTVEKIQDFQSSSMMKAAEEFLDFYTENFYSACFAGTYGMDGYMDIDEELEELSEKYGLTYASQKSKGNRFYEDAAVYDNGAWNAEFAVDQWGGNARIHYVPKNALYTALVPLADIAEYRRVWEYEVEGGLKLQCFTEGPTVLHGGHMLLETDDAYVLLSIGGTLPQDMQKAADLVDWAGIVKQEG